MIEWWSRRPLNQRLALLAFVLGVVAIPSTPARGPRLSIDGRQLSLKIQSGVDRVSPGTLARWIVEGRSDFRLVDLQTDQPSAGMPRIPTAEPIPLAGLLDAGFGHNEKILLVADDEMRAAQAWCLLQSAGYPGAAIVEGGLRGWREEVLYPRVDAVPAAQRETVIAMSRYFGGTPQSGGGDGSGSPMALPSVAAVPPGPVPNLPAGPGGGKKPAPAKKKEGC